MFYKTHNFYSIIGGNNSNQVQSRVEYFAFHTILIKFDIRAIYFWAYTTSKANLATSLGNTSPLNHLTSAFIAGITSNTVLFIIYYKRS